MKSPLNLTVLLMLMLALLPAAADEAVPKQAVGERTMLALYVDATQIDADQLAGMGQSFFEGLSGLAGAMGDEAALPLGDPEQIIDSLIMVRDSFVDAGGKGAMMTLEMPSEESWSPPMSLLVKTKDKFDAASMGALVQAMGAQAQMQSLGSGWRNILMTSAAGDAVTQPLPEPDDAAFAAMHKQLTVHDKPMFAMAFRMQDELRELMDQAQQEARNAQGGAGQDPQAQMMLGMAMGMFQPIRSLDTVGLSVSQVDGQPLIDARMTFLDAQSAQAFANAYNRIMLLAPVALAQVGQGDIENMPDPAKINQFFTSLQMTVDGDTLGMTLDQAFFELAEELAPLFEGLQGEFGDGLAL